MNNQLHFDLLNFLKNIDINSFDWTFYLTYNPELVFIGINDQSTAYQYFSQQSTPQITNQNLFFQTFQRSLTDPTAPTTKFDPSFYKSYYSIDHLFTPIDIVSYWLLSGFSNNQNVISKNSLIYYQQMDIDQIVHNTQTNTPNYLFSDLLQQQNNQTQDFLNNLRSQNLRSLPPSDQKQNLVIYFNQQLSSHFSSFKTHIDQYLSQSLQQNFDSYKNICDAYFQSKSSEFSLLLSSKSTQFQQLNLDKLNLFQDQNFQLISDLSKKFDDFQHQFLLFQQNLQKQSDLDSTQYKDFQLYIKQQSFLKKQTLQNTLLKNSFSSSPSIP